jgi:hypothetical protein
MKSVKFILSAVVVLFLSCALPVHADSVAASGAGSLPGTAQDLTGVTNLTEITGAIPVSIFGDIGESMFAINITDYADFSAETIAAGPFGIPDTVLALFDSSGYGVYLNDDIGGSVYSTLSYLPSGGVGPTSNGIYYLAISESFDYPTSDFGETFSPVLSTDVVGPDFTQGGGSPITGWDGGASGADTDLVNYDIVLTGTSSVPEPATWLLMALGLGLVFFFRKRIAAN